MRRITITVSLSREVDDNAAMNEINRALDGLRDDLGSFLLDARALPDARMRVTVKPAPKKEGA